NLHLLFRHHDAAAAGDHPAVFFPDQLAGGVRDILHLLLGDHDTTLAGHQLAVLLRHQLAGRVRNLLGYGIGNGLANRVVDYVTVFSLDVMASADRSDLLAGHPHALADPAAGTLGLQARVGAPRG